MAVLKCKMCGGDIQAADGAAYGTCESCGTMSTLPKASEEKTVNLFNRANHFRRLNEFDKALSAYESILNEDNANAEAHWCAVLCRYGIEYVEDPRTHERIPTCRRAQFEPVLSDPDYLAALEYAADEYTKSLYEDEAKKIGEIQKGILAISNKEEPYDVFICYKETTDGGSRTKDSTIAQDIYYELTNGGYKVFFAKITLEDKLGQEYEPYIFSALNSAKVMLVIGTRREYFEAVWVKNEWSRFLAIMKKDRSRLLIPCYRDMDAYDIPDELSNLQSQDMGKVGFIQDILRGVKKVLDASKSTEKTSSTASAGTAAPGVESLMKRGRLFLEDADWKQANEYFDKVLDIDPEYAPAYVGKLCAELEVKQEEQLTDNEELLTEYNHYQKAVRFANTDYRVKLEQYNKANQEHIAEKERQERERRAAQEKKDQEERDRRWSQKIEKEKEQERRRIENEKEQEHHRIEMKKKRQKHLLLGTVFGSIAGIGIGILFYGIASGTEGPSGGMFLLFLWIATIVLFCFLLRNKISSLFLRIIVGIIVGFIIISLFALIRASNFFVAIIIGIIIGTIGGGLIGWFKTGRYEEMNQSIYGTKSTISRINLHSQQGEGSKKCKNCSIRVSSEVSKCPKCGGVDFNYY